MIIYKAINTINGKSYIGQTIISFEKRKYKHIWSSENNCQTHFHSVIKKYGKENFKWEILHNNIFDIDTLNTLEELEIIIHDSFYNGYNMNKGGGNNNGFEHSEKTKRKISKACKGKKLSEKTKELMSRNHANVRGENNSFYGKKHSRETKKKMSISQRGENNPMYGKDFSEDHRYKLSISRKNKGLGKNNPMYGKNHSEKTKKKISEASKGKNNPSYRDDIKNNVILELKNKGFSNKEIAETIKCGVSTISRRLKGISNV